MGIGSGIVYDSDGVKEYAECLLKMKFLTDPVRRFELIETMLYEPDGGIWLRGYHLARLAASATYFGFAFDAVKVRDAIDAAIATRPAERLRVRLLLDEDGGVSVTATRAACVRRRCDDAVRHFRHPPQQRRSFPLPQDDAPRTL